jgi:hypothetical protein
MFSQNMSLTKYLTKFWVLPNLSLVNFSQNMNLTIFSQNLGFAKFEFS